MYRLYIGSDNITNRHNEKRIAVIIEKVSEYFDSFSYNLQKGVFRGQEEDTLIVTIGTEDGEKIESLARELRLLLHQDGVGIEHNGGYFRITD